VEAVGESLYEAVAALQKDNWVGEIGQEDSQPEWSQFGRLRGRRMCAKIALSQNGTAVIRG
jgi:hypothetical protein